jgi:trimethylamine:corrinoid methyltransferase-like protein
MLAFSDIGSTVQLMMDLELVDAMDHLAEGFSVDADSLAEEVIRQVAPRGAVFMDTEHTARHFRKALWIPELMDRRVASVALNDVSGMLDRARAKALRLMDEAPNACPLGREQRDGLLELLQEADRGYGA